MLPALKDRYNKQSAISEHMIPLPFYYMTIIVIKHVYFMKHKNTSAPEPAGPEAEVPKRSKRICNSKSAV